MQMVFPDFNIRKKYKIDFSLIPIGVILLEFSTLSTEVFKDKHRSVNALVLMRITHTIVLLLLAIGLALLYKAIKKEELSYISIAVSGLVIISIGIYLHEILVSIFDVESLGLARDIATGLLKGIIWFPAFLLIGSKRTEIFSRFRDYEQRLIVSTRANSRGSKEFQEIQLNMQEEIRNELFDKCDDLNSAIQKFDFESTEIEQANAHLQPLLIGEDLRRLSMKLETIGSRQSNSTFLGQNVNSVRLLANQFKILYEITSRKAPIKARTFTFFLMVLITPAFINYSTLKGTLIWYPLTAVAVYSASRLVTKTLGEKKKNSARNGSILIYLTGCIPFLFNFFGQMITHDPNAKYPIFISAIALPAGYYIFMKVLQVLQPTAIDSVKNDDLVASRELKVAITKIVTDEFSHTLAHRWAIFIHGKILTRLAATALKLETAKNAGDTAKYVATVRTLQNLLSQPDAEFEKVDTDLETEIASRLDPWLGLLDVSLHIDPELKSIRNTRVRDIGEVIEEIISNSMRHGRALEVDLNVKNLGEKLIEITAIDDATIAPPLNQIRFGLGTRIFNLASDGRWSITRVNSTTVFKLIMSIE
jgi:two-component sensor histidine kinase